MSRISATHLQLLAWSTPKTMCAYGTRTASKDGKWFYIYLLTIIPSSLDNQQLKVWFKHFHWQRSWLNLVVLHWTVVPARWRDRLFKNRWTSSLLNTYRKSISDCTAIPILLVQASFARGPGMATLFTTIWTVKTRRYGNSWTNAKKDYFNKCEYAPTTWYTKPARGITVTR